MGGRPHPPAMAPFPLPLLAPTFCSPAPPAAGVAGVDSLLRRVVVPAFLSAPCPLVRRQKARGSERARHAASRSSQRPAQRDCQQRGA